MICYNQLKVWKHGRGRRVSFFVGFKGVRRFVLRRGIHACVNGGMNKSEAVEKFYTTRAWRKCRADFVEMRGGLCEECWSKGIIEAGSADRPLEVHHIIPITDENLADPEITLSFNNLQLLCKDCHEKKKIRSWKVKRFTVDDDGNVTL